MTDQQYADNQPAEQASTTDTEAPQYGVGPFSIREVALGGIWLLALIVSFFPIYGRIGNGPSVWTNGIDWVLTIGLPTAAVFLIVLRRLSPDGIRRVGSLGIDQFASVAFSVSAFLWLSMIWNSFVTLASSDVFLATWVVWVEFFLMLAGVLLTVFGPFIAPFDQDFAGRREIPAHRNARPIRPVTPRPAPAPRPAPEPAAAPVAQPAGEPTAVWHADTDVDHDAAGAEAQPRPAAHVPVDEAPVDEAPATAAYDRVDDTLESARSVPERSRSTAPADPVDELFAGADDSDDDHAEPAAAATPAASTADVETAAWAPAQSRGTYEPVEQATPTRQQAFWALAPEERDVVDEVGIPIFRIGPTAWALVIEDRGETFVVRHDDGRIGYLHDVQGVTRG
ncbi:hypothetical protein [Microbacterium sp. Marseille-Q6648]|uniref:hypothetical protein n=1 Tax=Microbacterium sp. Marseille-Q6648 TaxID=2937991 RepID=UPI0020419F90|nr:hypothetical protein [Microbacterium sp. Marseille-Q6648]